MATIDVLTFKLSADTKAATRAARLLMPLVYLRLMSVERTTALAMRFVKVTVVPEIAGPPRDQPFRW